MSYSVYKGPVLFYAPLGTVPCVWYHKKISGCAFDFLHVQINNCACSENKNLACIKKREEWTVLFVSM